MATKEAEIQKEVEKESSFSKAFPNFNLEEPEEEEDIMYIFLWENNKSIYDIYKIIRLYLLENYHIDSTLLLRLFDEYKLDIVSSLQYIYFIHYGYLSIVLPKSSKE